MAAKSVGCLHNWWSDQLCETERTAQTHTHTICWPGQSGAESVVNAQLINMSLGPCIDASMKFSFSRRLLGKHKFDYVANSIYHAPSHASAWQGRLTQCIWEPTRCAHTHPFAQRQSKLHTWVACKSLRQVAAATTTTIWTHLKRERTSRTLSLLPVSLLPVSRQQFSLFTHLMGKAGRKFCENTA